MYRRRTKLPGNARTAGALALLPAVILCFIPSAASATTLSGEIVCADCSGGVGVELFVAEEPGSLISAYWLPSPGPFAFVVPDELGAVDLSAFRDYDGDGRADLGTDRVACPANPIDVTGGDVEELIVDLGTVTVDSVEISGTVTCADCTGSVGLLLLAADSAGGGLLAHLRLPRPGAFAVAAPADFGDVELFAYRDADGNGIPDVGTEIVASADNPITVADTPISDISIDLGAISGPQIVLSGSVTCADCAGSVGLMVFFGDEGGGAVLARIGLSAPSAFALSVPEDIGELSVYAYRDTDSDGRVDLGQSLVAYDSNPIVVADSDIAGVTIDLGDLGFESVQLSGDVICADCIGGVGVMMMADNGLGGGLLAHIGLPAPGPFSFAAPSTFGDVALYAYRDADRNGRVDIGGGLVASADNPITVAADDIAGLNIDLGTLPVIPTVRVAGSVLCADCPKGVGVRVVGGTDPGGPVVEHVGLPAPGGYAVDVPVEFGEAWVSAYRDLDRDGRPDVGTVPVWCADNPIQLTHGDTLDADVDLGTVGIDTVALSGRVDCEDCAGGVGLWVDWVDDDLFARLAHIGLPGPMSFAVDLPEAIGQVEVWAYRDADDNGVPDLGTEPVAYAANPIDVADLDISDIVIDLGNITPPQVTISGEVVCDACPGPVGLMVIFSDGLGLLYHLKLPQPGPFAVNAPQDIGLLDIFTYRDDDGDGRVDFGCDLIGFAGNPLDVGDADITDVVIDIGSCRVEPIPDGVDEPADMPADAGDVGDAGDAGDVSDLADLDTSDAGDVTPDVDDFDFEPDSVDPDGPDSVDATSDTGEDSGLDVVEPGDSDDGCGCRGAGLLPVSDSNGRDVTWLWAALLAFYVSCRRRSFGALASGRLASVPLARSGQATRMVASRPEASGPSQKHNLRFKKGYGVADEPTHSPTPRPASRRNAPRPNRLRRHRRPARPVRLSGAQLRRSRNFARRGRAAAGRIDRPAAHLRRDTRRW